jgi:hypothetical protein
LALHLNEWHKIRLMFGNYSRFGTKSHRELATWSKISAFRFL